MSYDLIIPIKENDCCVKILDGFFQVSICIAYVTIDSIFLQM